MADSFDRGSFAWVDGVTPITDTQLNYRDVALEAIDDRVAVLETTGGVTPIILAAVSGTITPNANAGSLFRHTATADVELADPTGGVDGQTVTVEVEASGADRILSFDGSAVTVTVPEDAWWRGEYTYHQSTSEWLLDTGGSGGPTLVEGANVTLTDNGDGTVTIAAATTGASGIPATTVNARGDLIAGTADDTVARLAVGADGQVLTASSGATTGLAWSNPGTTPAAGSVVDASVSASAAIALSKTADSSGGAGRLAMTTAERNKLAALAAIASSGSASDLSTGTVPIARVPTGTTSTTVSLGNHTHAASDVASGTLAAARLGGGTASASTILYGDSTWKPSGLGVHAVGNSGSALTLDVSHASGSIKTITLTANCTLTLTGATSGTAATLELVLTQDATGSRTITWPASVKWSGGAPTLSTAAASVDRIVLTTYNGGTTWYADLVGKGYA